MLTLLFIDGDEEMSKFYWVMFYFAIGGALVGLTAVQMQRDCGVKISTTEFAAISAVWPALMVSAFAIKLMNTDGMSECKK